MSQQYYDRPVKYNYEYERKLKIAHVGCGGHSFRNIFPVYQYAPVDLVAVCDRRKEMADRFARQFGAASAYADVTEMLAAERPDVVVIVTSYKEDGTPQSVDIALESLKAGCHVWMEKPPAASVAQVKALAAAAIKANRQVMVGFKKMFFPGVQKIKEIVDRTEEFGKKTSIYVRYPQSIPPFAERKDGRTMIGFLDHIMHPGSIIHYLMGSIESLCYQEEQITGASVAVLKFVSGAVGTLHLAAGSSGQSPLERVEVVGDGANIVLDNGVKLTFYRKGDRGEYGRSINFTGSNDNAPLHWEPEFSLGNLYNKNLFMLGYAQEFLCFCECILAGRHIELANLEDALAALRLYEAYRNNPPGVIVRLQD